MKISQRTSKGWAKRENNKKWECDVCRSKLWESPSGEIYCDNIHDSIKNPFDIITHINGKKLK